MFPPARQLAPERIPGSPPPATTAPNSPGLSEAGHSKTEQPAPSARTPNLPLPFARFAVDPPVPGARGLTEPEFAPAGFVA